MGMTVIKYDFLEFLNNSKCGLDSFSEVMVLRMDGDADFHVIGFMLNLVFREVG